MKILLFSLFLSTLVFGIEIIVDESTNINGKTINIYKLSHTEDIVHARHILVRSSSEAQDILNELGKLKGESQRLKFIALAKERSLGPSGPKGGDLGKIKRNMMVKAFDDAIFKMKVGEIAKVKTQFGYHVIYVEARKYKHRGPSLNDDSTTQAKLFDKVLEDLIRQELKKIPKPSANLQIKKDQFETTSEFQARVEKTKIKQKEAILQYKKTYKKTEKYAKLNAVKKTLMLLWGKPIIKNLNYDADNGYFVADISFEIKNSFHKKIAIKVPRTEARNFNNNFKNLKPQAVFEYENNSIALKDIRIPYQKKTYLAQFTDLSVSDTQIAVNIQNEIQMPSLYNATSVTVSQSQVATLDTSKLKSFNDLDLLLAKTKTQKRDKKKWLFVIGIEKYDYTDNIRFAKRSAEMFVKVAHKKLGVLKQNSYVLIDGQATQAKIKTSMKKMLRRVKMGDTIYFYYNGHGVPVPKLKNEPFMLTSDTEPDFVADEVFFSLKNIYAKLSDSKATKVVAIVDSCFSGVTDGVGVMKGVAATKMVAKKVHFDKDKMVVLSAGKSYQYSNGYNKKGHRLFSFFVMKNILEGDKSIKKLYKDTKTQTYNASMEEYGDSRTQEPTIDGNFRMKL